ncbi:MAG: glycosyltransferase [Candidatus Omnitrophota bacterium]|nr:glycosyltransferase [Candidatus Omnitrophota bacterium]
MRIIYITYDGVLDPVSQSQVLPYIEGLSRAGNVFTLISFEKKGRFRDDKTVNACNDRLKKNGISWAPMVYHKRPAAPATALDALKGTIKAFRIIKNSGAEAVHARGYVSMLIAYILKRAAGVRIIFDMRGFWAEEKVDAGAWKRGGILYRIVKRMENIFLANADEIVVLTNAAKRCLIEKTLTKAPITVIPCCADLDIFKMSSGKKSRDGKGVIAGPVILYAGSLGSFYSLDKILDFFLFFKEKNPSAFLKIVSHYPKEAMDRAVSSHNIEKMWYSLEALDYVKMPEAFSGADLSIIFYNRPLSGAGCSPIKLAESLACGTPVVINSGIGDCDSVVEDNRVGVVIRQFSESEYARASRAIAGLLAEGEHARRRCRELAERLFSLERGLKAYQNVYTKMSG